MIRPEITQQMKERGFILKAYTKKELQELYGIPRRTFIKWLKPYRDTWGIGMQKQLTILQVELIVSTFGVPGTFSEK